MEILHCRCISNAVPTEWFAQNLGGTLSHSPTLSPRPLSTPCAHGAGMLRAPTLSFQWCSEHSSDGGGFSPHFISFANRNGRRGFVLARNQRQGILNGSPNTRLHHSTAGPGGTTCSEDVHCNTHRSRGSMPPTTPVPPPPSRVNSTIAPTCANGSSHNELHLAAGTPHLAQCFLQPHIFSVLPPEPTAQPARASCAPSSCARGY